MRTTWTAEKCLERACRLMLMADEARNYQQILLYDGLAQEWLQLAARLSRQWQAGAPQPAFSRPRRFAWRELRAWFR